MLTNILPVLKQSFGSRLATGESVRAQHGRDYSKHPEHWPDAVVFAETAEEVAQVVRLCAEARVPVVAYGVGSSTEGHVLPVRGGITLDVSGMKKIIAIRPDDLDATVEPGVTRTELNRALRPYGLFFPVDPGADASLGGMTATGASGTMAVRYGTMREQLRGVGFVDGTGRQVRPGTRARKTSAGYDLTRLIAGSEGTLGIITEITLRVFPLPEAMAAAVCNFPSSEAAVRAVIQAMQFGLPIARAELMDEMAVLAINRHSKLSLREVPTLLLEFHGDKAAIESLSATMQEICAAEGGGGFEWAAQAEDRTRLWQARHEAMFACAELCPGAGYYTTDVCVPISALAQCIAETKADAAASGLVAPVLGHVGDGNFHMMMLLDPAIPDAWDRAEAVNQRLIARAQAAGGTCSGEHGVGIGKREFLPAERGEVAIELMRGIKKVFDPYGILNPGKIFLDEVSN